MNSLQLFILIVYGLGCALSQSLMSLGGSLASLWAFIFTIRGWKSFKPSEKVFLSVLWSWVLFSIANLGLRSWDAYSLHSLKDLPYFGMLSLCLVKEKSPHRDSIVKVVIAGLAVTLGLTLYQWFIQRHPGGGFFGNPSYLAYNQLFTFLFFAELFRQGPSACPLSRKWVLAGILFPTVTIALTESRFVFFLVGLYLLIFLVPLVYRRLGLKICLLLALISSALALGMYRFEPRVKTKVDRTLFRSEEDPSETWRIKAWMHSWELFKNSPWVGVGPEKNAIDSGLNPHFAGHWEAGHRIYAHSIYFQSLADSGLIGSLLFFSAFILLFILIPSVRVYLLFFAVAGIMENLFNNSKAIHSFYFYLILSCYFLRSPQKDV